MKNKLRLSILIPARNEEFLQKTIDDVFEHSETDTEVIVGLDGWHTKLKKRPNLRIFRKSSPIGQRAMQNLLARQSKAKFIMKLDAHCSLSQGFDRIMLEIKDLIFQFWDVDNFEMLHEVKAIQGRHSWDTSLEK